MSFGKKTEKSSESPVIRLFIPSPSFMSSTKAGEIVKQVLVIGDRVAVPFTEIPD